MMVAEGGLRALWRGNGVNILKNCPESAIRFGLHGHLRCLLFPGQAELTLRERITVASMAGAASLTCVYPVEVSFACVFICVV
ncbi:unnamed protein product [Protopolystoma xenopodis]|uniref:ADP/ATP translocase n=1 Tax=Protopolystoma xenopodis TaxID=117903 RepID=A0A3S5FEI9_9PLAT|nr:unnamed protein product [Protopolystoma xenopodis]